MQKEVGKVHTHLMAHSRVTSAILPAILFGGGMVALCSSMYRLYTGAYRRRTLLRSAHAQNIGLRHHTTVSHPEPLRSQALASATCRWRDARVTPC